MCEGVPYFYPRHPRGWRREHADAGTDEPHISIHATLAGGDFFRPAQTEMPKNFYPRHPRGWRPQDAAAYAIACIFLSTPPSRVATSEHLCGEMPPQRISIHATLAGGDPKQAPRDGEEGKNFYPRHPRGWRPHVAHADGDEGAFLSTPPSRVATGTTFRVTSKPEEFLSTPPSRVATSGFLLLCFDKAYFYPRHPRGWRQTLQWFASRLWTKFLSTPPSRVATRTSA